MTRTFIETASFRKRVDAEGGNELLRAIQNELLKDLAAGDLIQGTGGIRKLRFSDRGRGKGKRGGYRILYLDLPRAGETYLLALYDKGEKADVSAQERAVLKQLVQMLKEMAREKD